MSPSPALATERSRGAEGREGGAVKKNVEGEELEEGEAHWHRSVAN